MSLMTSSQKTLTNMLYGADWEANLINIPADLFRKLTDSLDDISDGSSYKRAATAALDTNHLVLLSAAVGSLDNIAAGSTNVHFTTGDDTKLGGIEAGATVGANWSTNLTNIPTDLFRTLTDTLDDITNGTTYGKVLVTNISAGKILLAQCDNTDYNLDDVADGASYGKILLTDISAGHILLASCSGDLDDIANGTSYGKVLLTDISAGHILLSACSGSLDDIDNGTSYGKVALTDISAGHILLSSCSGDLDDISDGTTKVGYTPAEQSKLSGIAAGATVGANWTTNLSNIPATLQTPGSSGLYLSSTYMGFYTGAAWTAYIDNSGNFYFKGDANSSIDWNITTASTLTIKGKLTAGTGSSINGSYITASSISADKLTASYIEVGGAASDVNSGATTISGGKITASSIEASKLSVSTLSAISADLGTITAGTITGGTVQTAASGARVVLNSTGIHGYSATAELTTISNTTGILTMKTAASGARLEIDGTNGIRGYDASSNVLIQITPAGAFTLKTAASGARVEMDTTNGIRVYNSGGTLTSTISTAGSQIWTNDLSAETSALGAAAGTSLSITNDINANGVFKVDSVQVVSTQGAHVPYATTVEDIFGVVNAIIDRLRAHGLIASS